MKKLEKVEYIVIHHSASEWGNKEIINKWHKQRGFAMIGYHYVINNGFPEKEYKFAWDGLIEKGRPLYLAGAHVKGYNTVSIGICLIGNYKFTLNQFASLASLLKQLKNKYPDAKIVGHCDLNPVKKYECPGFDIQTFLDYFMIKKIKGGD